VPFFAVFGRNRHKPSNPVVPIFAAWATDELAVIIRFGASSVKAKLKRVTFAATFLLAALAALESEGLRLEDL